MDNEFCQLNGIHMPILVYEVEYILHEHLEHIAVFPQHEKKSLQFLRGFRSKLLANISLKLFFSCSNGGGLWVLVPLTFQKILNAEIGGEPLKFCIVLKKVLIVIQVESLDLLLGFTNLQLVDLVPLVVRLQSFLIVDKFCEKILAFLHSIIFLHFIKYEYL